MARTLRIENAPSGHTADPFTVDVYDDTDTLTETITVSQVSPQVYEGEIAEPDSVGDCRLVYKWAGNEVGGSHVTSSATDGTTSYARKLVKIAGTIQTIDAVWVKIKKWLQLLIRKDAAITTDNATELTEINANGGSGAGGYANTAESIEAIAVNIAAIPVPGSNPNISTETTVIEVN